MAEILTSQNGTHEFAGSSPLIPEEGMTLASKLTKGLKLETPVETYEQDSKVPGEFLVNDPKIIPNRCWGDNDESKPNFEFPVINLAPLMRFFADKPHPGDEEATKKIIEDIGTASEDWGFFQAENHSIPVELLDQVVKVSHEFFQLPLEEKAKYAVRPGETEGYGVDNSAGLGAGKARTRFWTDVLRHDIRPVPSNKDRIPLKPEAYRPLMEEYTQGLEKVFLSVWKALSVYLGLAPDALMKGQERDDDESHLLIRLNYYPKCSEPERVLGTGAHKDKGSLTILLQDEVGGLQVQKPGTTGWLDVPPNKGANRGRLLINIANQVEVNDTLPSTKLQPTGEVVGFAESDQGLKYPHISTELVMSNGRLHSVLHRVLVNRDSSRLSVAAFATPGPKCVIAPLQEVLEKSGQAPRYTSLLYGNYIKDFMADAKAGRSPHARYEINRN